MVSIPMVLQSAKISYFCNRFSGIENRCSQKTNNDLPIKQ